LALVWISLGVMPRKPRRAIQRVWTMLSKYIPVGARVVGEEAEVVVLRVGISIVGRGEGDVGADAAVDAVAECADLGAMSESSKKGKEVYLRTRPRCRWQRVQRSRTSSSGCGGGWRGRGEG
jgi:hypothetical protein